MIIWTLVFGLGVFGLLILFQTFATGGIPQSRTYQMKQRVRYNRGRFRR